MSSHLKQRLIVGGLGILVLLFSIYFSYSPAFEPFFVLLNAAFISLAVLEYYHLTQSKGNQPLVFLGISFSIGYVIAVYLGQNYPALHFIPFLILYFALLSSFLFFFNRQANPLTNLAITLFGIAYLTIPLSFVLKINYFNFPNAQEDGRLWLAYVLAVSKITDVGAYFVGKTMGKTKLAPHISPKKTVEGALGGLGAALLMSLAFYFYLNSRPEFTPWTMSLWESIWIGLFISIFAQFGDLAESILKRDAGVKNSSDLPGLGGMLDIVDSLVFTLPFMYLILKMKLLS